MDTQAHYNAIGHKDKVDSSKVQLVGSSGCILLLVGSTTGRLESLEPTRLTPADMWSNPEDTLDATI